MSEHRFPYKWYLKDGYPESNGLNVFGTFICGGGSTMGYKLAGFNHLGGVEIDPKIADVYKTNHKPKHLFNEDIREFNKRTDLPKELYNLDILDGSPPCSTFSMAGSREKGWGKEKVFREGQAMQTLDDLVFVYCDTIIKLQPKVFLLENVKGIIQGNAKSYSKKIVQKMAKAGYTVQVFCLNAASMGVPQKRERVFFIGYRNGLDYPKLKLEFNERAVTVDDCFGISENIIGNKLGDKAKALFDKTPQGKSLSFAHPNGSYFNWIKLAFKGIAPTIAGAGGTFGNYAAGSPLIHPEQPNEVHPDIYKLFGTYPLDYNFKTVEPKYLIGMSVPPVMTAQIAHQIYLQWFKTENKQ
jgi:DNA (cytosine-5)-methyltransferase 1